MLEVRTSSPNLRVSPRAESSLLIKEKKTPVPIMVQQALLSLGAEGAFTMEDVLKTINRTDRPNGKYALAKPAGVRSSLRKMACVRRALDPEMTEYQREEPCKELCQTCSSNQHNTWGCVIVDSALERHYASENVSLSEQEEEKYTHALAILEEMEKILLKGIETDERLYKRALSLFMSHMGVEIATAVELFKEGKISLYGWSPKKAVGALEGIQELIQ